MRKINPLYRIVLTGVEPVICFMLIHLKTETLLISPNAVAFEYKMDAILFLFIQLVQASVVS